MKTNAYRWLTALAVALSLSPVACGADPAAGEAPAAPPAGERRDAVVSPFARLLDPNADARTYVLWDYLKSQYGHNMLTGQWTESQYGGTQRVYNDTGRYPAIWAQDMSTWTLDRNDPVWNHVWQSNIESFRIAHERGQILQVNWHWQNPLMKTNGVYAPGDAGGSGTAWSRLTDEQWEQIVTPGTAAYDAMIEDLDYHVVNFLKKLVDAEGRPMPLLFRPLHEIDGGWFWWTCGSDPTKSARLFRIIQDRIINYHNVHNLIWVWNNGVQMDGGGWPPFHPDEYARRKLFYPGDEHCDLVGIDLYEFEPMTRGTYAFTGKTYRDVWNMMTDIAPTKMVALCETDVTPDVDKSFNDGTYAPWLYELAWFADRPGYDAWNHQQYRSSRAVTADQLPRIGAGAGPGCTDEPPTGAFTCAEQASFGQCGESWMQDYCKASCGRC